MKLWIIWVLFGAAILAGLADIGFNLLSLLPYIGSAFESVAETILEFFQGVVLLVLAVLASAAGE
jgi:hypothetical protein